MKRKPLFLLISIVIFVAACAGNITINPAYQPPPKTEPLLASVPPIRIKLLNFEDKREPRAEAILIGRRQAAGGVPIGDVFSERPVFEIIRDAVRTELIRSGYSVVSDNEDISIKGEILKFWVGTDVTMLYWDVIGEVSIALEVKKSAAVAPIPFGPYSGKNVERTYSNPSAEIATNVLAKSLEDVMHSMSSDREFMKVLRSKQYALNRITTARVTSR